MKGIGFNNITKRFYYINGKKKDDVTEYINEIVFQVSDKLIKENTALKTDLDKTLKQVERLKKENSKLKKQVGSQENK